MLLWHQFDDLKYQYVQYNYVNYNPNGTVVSGVQGVLVQKKKTIYLEWDNSFDSHLKDGRVIQVCITPFCV